MTNRTLLRKLARDIWRGKGPFAAAVVVVTLGVVLLGASYASYRNLFRSYQHSYDLLHFADFVADVTNPPPDLDARLRALDGVQAVEARLVGEVPGVPPSGDAQGVQVRLVSLPAPAQPAVDDVLLYQGNPITDPNARDVLVESSFADFYDLHPGDQVTVVANGAAEALTIAGLVRTAEYILPVPSAQYLFPSPRSFAVLYTPLANVQRLLGTAARYNQLAVEVGAPDARAGVVAALRGLAGPGVITSIVLQEDQASHAALQLDLDGFQEMAVLFPAIFFGAAAFSIYIILGRMIRSQIPQIGLLRAIGFGSRTLVGHYLAYALSIGVSGAVLGSIVGFLLGGGMTRFYTEFINVPVVRVEPEWGAIAIGAVGAVVVCVAAALLPALRAARIQPAQAMRGDPAVAPLHVRRVGRRLPSTIRLGLRNTLRSPWRSAATGGVIAIAAAVLVVSIGFLDSINDLIDHEFDRAFSYDAMVHFREPVPAADAAQRVAGVAGTSAAEPAMQLPVELRHGDERFGTLLIGVAANATMVRVYDVDRRRVALGDGLAVAAGLETRLHLAVGDTLELASPLGTVTLPVDRFVGSATGSAVYARLDRVQELFGASDLVNAFTVTAAPGMTADTVAGLRALPLARQVEVPSELRESLNELLGLAWAFIGLMIVLAGLLAFAVVFNTVIVTVMERQRELATLRMLGMGIRRVAGILFTEMVLIAVPGVLIGLGLGRLLTNPAVQVFNSELFFIDQPVVQPIGVALVGVLLLVVAVLALVPGLRHVSRMNLANVARESAG